MTILMTFSLALAENILSVDGSFLLIFLLVICLIFILNATLFKPINQILEERERLSRGRLSEAGQTLAQYEEKLKKYEDQMRAARADAYEMLESNRKQALATQQELLAQARSETAAQVAAAKAELADQIAAARARLEQEAGVMAATISSNILQRPITTPEGISAA